jgi:hypothetical protein
MVLRDCMTIMISCTARINARKPKLVLSGNSIRPHIIYLVGASSKRLLRACHLVILLQGKLVPEQLVYHNPTFLEFSTTPVTVLELELIFHPLALYNQPNSMFHFVHTYC